MGTKIEWTDVTWNPVTGCAKVSQGCKHCYAERVFPRAYANAWIPDGKGGMRIRNFTDVLTHPDRLDAPLHWRKPRRIFVNSMSDLFHEAVPEEFIDQIFAVMALAPQHTFQVLTKRAQRMVMYATALTTDRLCQTAYGLFAGKPHAYSERLVPMFYGKTLDWWRAFGVEEIRRKKLPLPNVHLGVSAEDQETADERVPQLLQTPAAVRFVSYEPALGPVDFSPWLFTRPSDRLLGPLDWVIVGGESGPNARPCNVEWIESTIEQCKATRVPCFVKQLGRILEIPNRKVNGVTVVSEFIDTARDAKADPECWGEHLRVREFPKAEAEE